MDQCAQSEMRVEFNSPDISSLPINSLLVNARKLNDLGWSKRVVEYIVEVVSSRNVEMRVAVVSRSEDSAVIAIVERIVREHCMERNMPLLHETTMS